MSKIKKNYPWLNKKPNSAKRLVERAKNTCQLINFWKKEIALPRKK